MLIRYLVLCVGAALATTAQFTFPKPIRPGSAFGGSVMEFLSPAKYKRWLRATMFLGFWSFPLEVWAGIHYVGWLTGLFLPLLVVLIVGPLLMRMHFDPRNIFWAAIGTICLGLILLLTAPGAASAS